MVSKTFFVILAVCLTQALAKPSGDDNISTLTAQVQGLMETWSNEMKQVLQFKETKESKAITDNLKTNANEFAGKLSELLTTANKEAEAHKGDLNSAVEDLKTKVAETVKKIQENHPDEAAKAKEYQESIKKTYEELLAKTKEATDSLAKDTSGLQENMHKFTENIVKEVRTNLEKINAEIKASIDAHQKEHKH